MSLKYEPVSEPQVHERSEFFPGPGPSGGNATAVGACQTGQNGQTGQHGQTGAMGAAGKSVAAGGAGGSAVATGQSGQTGAKGNSSGKVSGAERRYEVQTDEALAAWATQQRELVREGRVSAPREALLEVT